MTAAFKFRREAGAAVLKALGLEGRRVRRIEMVFDVDAPVTMTVYEYVDYDGLPALLHFFEMAEWTESHAD